jgi:glucokinase
MTPERGLVGAVDWGGTWIRFALVEQGRIVHRDRVRRPQPVSAQYLAVADLITRSGRAPDAVGVGIAGVVQRGAVMTAINLGITSATPVTDELVAVLGCPVHLVNDLQAAAIAFAHHWPAGSTSVLSMGTGIGGAAVVDGRLYTGNGAGGDFGHMVVDLHGGRCPCGGTGCLETLVSGKLLADAAERLSDESEVLAERKVTGRPLHAGDLQDAAAAGERGAFAVLDTAAMALAAGIRSIVASWDPTRVLLVGQLLAEDAFFGQIVRGHWARLRPAWCETDLTHAADDEDAALLGAARYAAG